MHHHTPQHTSVTKSDSINPLQMEIPLEQVEKGQNVKTKLVIAESVAQPLWSWKRIAFIVFPLVVGLTIYIMLIVFAAQQAQSAKTSSNSAIYSQTKVDNSGWIVNRAVIPYSEGSIWDPTSINTYSGVYEKGVNSSANGARLEMTMNSFSPSYTGGTATVKFRLIISGNWLNKFTIPYSPLFTTTCYIGSAVLSLTSKSSTNYVDVIVNSFGVDNGTILDYPFDIYKAQTTSYCTYSYPIYNDDNTVDYYKDGYLNYFIAVGSTDVGLFSISASYQAPSIEKEILYYDDDYYGSHNHGNFSFISLNYADTIFTLKRGNINAVFPVFISFLMWSIVIAETLIFVPYYLEKKKADAPGIPLGAVGIMFALPNIRNTMPGAPPLGVVLDFSTYFWCLGIAASHFLIVAWYWVGLASSFTSTDIWVGTVKLLHMDKLNACKKD